MPNDHTRFMKKAIELAQTALEHNEFPVGCVLVYQNRIIAQGARKGTYKAIPSELDHAEMIALRELEKRTESIDRMAITLYSTLEPCLMCFGALMISGIGTMVYAYEDAMGGGTACDLNRLPALYRDKSRTIISDICRNESLALFKTYFSRPDIGYWRDSLLARYTLAQK